MVLADIINLYVLYINLLVNIYLCWNSATWAVGASIDASFVLLHSLCRMTVISEEANQNNIFFVFFVCLLIFTILSESHVLLRVLSSEITLGGAQGTKRSNKVRTLLTACHAMQVPYSLYNYFSGFWSIFFEAGVRNISPRPEK